MRKLLERFGLVAAPERGASSAAADHADAPQPVLDPFFGDATGHTLRSEMEHGDYAGFAALYGLLDDPDDRAFYVEALSDWPEPPAWLAEWAQRQPQSSLAHLMQGAGAVHWAWRARGKGYSDTVADDAWKVFFERLEFADSCLRQAAETDPDDPTPWALMIRAARGLQLEPEQVRERFAGACQRAPQHRAAHSQMLQSLCEKWGGSHERMFHFARAASADAPCGSGLHVLLPEAHIERAIADDRSIGAMKAYFRQPVARNDIRQAAERGCDAPRGSVRRDALRNRNYYACCLWLAGLTDQAATQFIAIGPWASETPWCFLGEPRETFTLARNECGLR